MTILYDSQVCFMTRKFEDMKSLIKYCGLGCIPAKDVSFIAIIKGEEENDKNY